MTSMTTRTALELDIESLSDSILSKDHEAARRLCEVRDQCGEFETDLETLPEYIDVVIDG